jgi:putative aldouronate transport system permease protein
MTNQNSITKMSINDKIFETAIYLLSIIVFIAVLYPLYFIVVASISDPGLVVTGKVWFLPKGINSKGYMKVFEDMRIWNGYLNTIAYTIAGTLVNLCVTMPAAYALSRKDFGLRNILMIFFVITMFFSGGLIPTYMLIQKLGMVDTFSVMVIPFSLNVFYLILARTFFASSIPNELRDAASVDGCSTTRFFFRIVIPLSKPIIAVIALYCAVGYWNEFFRALIYLRDDKKFPLQIILMDILVRNHVTVTAGGDLADLERIKISAIIKYALIIVSTVPIMCVYPFIQKYFTKGVMIGSIKG